MAITTDCRQITMYVPTEMLQKVDALAGNCKRTKWILKAVEQRLGDEGTDPRLERIADLYGALGDADRAMLAKFAEFLAQDSRRS